MTISNRVLASADIIENLRAILYPTSGDVHSAVRAVAKLVHP